MEKQKLLGKLREISELPEIEEIVIHHHHFSKEELKELIKKGFSVKSHKSTIWVEKYKEIRDIEIEISGFLEQLDERKEILKELKEFEKEVRE